VFQPVWMGAFALGCSRLRDPVGPPSDRGSGRSQMPGPATMLRSDRPSDRSSDRGIEVIVFDAFP
jgi:hypothetical protein